MNATHRPGAGRLAALVVLAAALGCGGPEPEAAPELRPVRTHRVEASGATAERTLAGVARAGVESRLSFRVAGTVVAVHVALGDSVRKGQVLARLDPTDYELKVEEAEAALAQGEAGLRRAQADYERVRALYENNNASKSELDAGRAAAESAQAQVRAVRKQLDLAQQQLGYTVLRAPIDGAVAEVDVEINEAVRSGEEVFLLTAGARPEVEVAVPEVMIVAVEMRQPVSVVFDALPGRVLAAEVAKVGVAAIGAASTFTVVARLVEEAPEVRPGMAAEVTFRLRSPGRERRIVVPGVAVGEDREGRYVFVLERGAGEAAGEGVVRRRAVEVGDEVQGLGGIEIRSGLEAGEEVVTAGVRRLADGMRVRTADVAGGGA